jgi:hypothetical protein
MNLKVWKTSIVSLGLAGAFLLSAGNSANVSAQDWRRNSPQRERQQRNDDYRRNGGNGQVNPVTGNIDNNNNGVDDRYETRDGRVDQNRNGVADQDENYRRYDDRPYGNGRYGNDGYYRNNGNYRNNGYGSYGYNSEQERGYRDGLNRGRQDAQTRRAADPNNSSHYRNGSQAYREGFRRGFFESYRQYQSYRRW